MEMNNQEVYIGIDESGSSKYLDKDNIFVLCAVCIEKNDYTSIALQIEKFLKKENIKEVKYSKFTTRRTKEFLDTLNRHKIKTFFVDRVIKNNTNIEDVYKESLYELIDEIKKYKFESKLNIQIDEMHGEKKQNIIKKKILEKIGNQNKNKVQYVASHKSIIVQISDMYAGLKRKELLEIYKNK
jgi:hypothetical protein